MSGGAATLRRVTSRPPSKPRASSRDSHRREPQPASTAIVAVPPTFIADWRTVPQLLGELMAAFGWRSDRVLPAKVTSRMLGGLSTDPKAREENARREEAEAWPLLRELVGRTEALRKVPLLRPADYAREWCEIISTWNQAIRERGWLEMTPLCEICGMAVQRRAVWRDPTLVGGSQCSFVCSEQCRAAYRQRAHRLKVKLSEPTNPRKRQPASNKSKKSRTG